MVANQHALVHSLIDALPEDLRLPLVLSAFEELNSAGSATSLGPEAPSARACSGLAKCSARSSFACRTLAIRRLAVHNSDELDLLLDSALATYADPGPGSGLEQRILTRISAETAPAPRRRRLCGPSLCRPPPACFFFLSTPKHPHPPSGRTEQSHPSQEAPFIATHTGSRPAHHLEAPQDPRSRLAKRNQSPSPSRPTCSLSEARRLPYSSSTYSRGAGARRLRRAGPGA